MNKYLIMVVVLWLHMSTATSQEITRQLQVGDTIPEELWNMSFGVVNHPAGKDSITLNDYRDKELIIFDFWGEYCVPCHYGFFKVDGLPDFLPQIQFLLVNSKSRYRPELTMPHRVDSVLTSLKEKLAYPNGLQVASIVEDTVLSDIFLRQTETSWNSIPHYVWIGKDGVVMNITKSSEVDYYNIRTFLWYQKRKQLSKAGVPHDEVIKRVRF